MRQLELEKFYNYGDVAFISISNEAGPENSRITLQKLMCLKAFGINGTIKPYRMYEFRDNSNENDINTILNEIKELEFYEATDKLIAKSLRMYQNYVGETSFIRYDGEGNRYYFLRNADWKKLNTYTPITPKERYNGAGFARTDSYFKNNSRYLKDFPSNQSFKQHQLEVIHSVNAKKEAPTQRV